MLFELCINVLYSTLHGFSPRSVNHDSKAVVVVSVFPGNHKGHVFKAQGKKIK